jgi:hypothetical protein
VSEPALASARQSWRGAEARLYPLAMTNVDGYQRALVLVAAMCERLRAVTRTLDDLLRCQDEAAEYVAAACDSTGTSAQGLDIDDLFGSAAAARDRELAADERRLARLTAVRRARAAGSEWADVHADQLGSRVPELRVHVESGWALLTAMGADETTGTPVLVVTTVQIDAMTGEVRDRPDREVHSVRSADEWERLARALQADVR